MMTRASCEGAVSSGSIAAMSGFPVAETRIARRPPNRPIVLASSTSFSGSAAIASPSMRMSWKASSGSSTLLRASVAALSATSPVSGP